MSGISITHHFGVNTRITQVTVCALAEDNPEYSARAITVEWRGGETYAVKRRSHVLSVGGEWDYEPLPSSRDDDWIATHRFDYEHALQLAVRAAADVQDQEPCRCGFGTSRQE